MDVSAASARMILKKKIGFENWLDTELMGATKRQKAKHEAQQAQEKLEIRMYNAEIQKLIDLTDEQLEWLLENGWDPREA